MIFLGLWIPKFSKKKSKIIFQSSIAKQVISGKMFEFSDLAPTLFEAYSENSKRPVFLLISFSNMSRMNLEHDPKERDFG